MILFIVLFISLVIYFVYLGISSTGSSSYRGFDTNNKSNIERDIEDLRRMKKYEFWRDFEK